MTPVRIVSREEMDAYLKEQWQAQARTHPGCVKCRVMAQFAFESLMWDLCCAVCGTAMRWHYTLHPHAGNAPWLGNQDCVGFVLRHDG